ncbi:putative endonuclease 4 [Siminovitchia terrae]|uniref:Deoxyribonuclease IV n=1 Tax=Siminovitchia terrae TaxID=1914933 RepID=A0A429XA26_SIMTE|nr:deoxyribonuclease IV [Siminovitchia terrae]RST60277.1 deoxyribonuclease IV [Siminovitchia terrae]GIN89809.1 putative endonuclease 4 [Siminovitchia terrae]GIN97895.1 putative endonuclease 4 [Siminovitchia terrae]
MRFGCHLSIRDGYLGAAKKAYAINASAFQYFPKNPRSLSVKDYNKEDAALCKTFCKENGILSVSHSPYPTSLTPHNDQKRVHIIDSLLNDLEITEACGSIGVVVHFGKPVPHLTLLESYQLMIEMLNDILKQWEGTAKILLENNAGIPGTMGTTLEELVQIRKLSEFPEKIGFCLDTCHAFSCGLWDGENWNDVLKKGEGLHYFDGLEVIHLNNSKYEAGKGKDRHASIFKGGRITLEQFDQLINTPLLVNTPFILETPKEEVPHTKEIQLLQDRWGD